MNTKYIEFILGTAMLLSGVFSTVAQSMRPGNASTTVELWLRSDKGIATTNNYVTSWADQSVNARDYTATANWPTFNESTRLMNFHPSIDFSGGNQRLIGPAHFLNSTKAYYVFYVSEVSSSSAFGTVYAFNSARNNNYGWTNGAPSFSTAGTSYTHQGNSRLYGINAVMIPNTSAATAPVTPQQFYMNGVINTTTIGSAVLATGTGDGVIGSSRTTSYYPFNGYIQEIIVLSGNQGSYLPSTAGMNDFAKVYSYLAIKYGITLETGDYVASDETVVWNRTENNGYNNTVFGIGRDNESSLNQVQSRSVESDRITVFKGAALETLNGNNPSIGTAFPDDKTFLMLGSNGATGTVPYVYDDTDNFAEGAIAEKVNYRDAAVYKAQVTTGGAAGGSQTVNIKVASNIANYVLVSGNATFLPISTRVYKIENLVALNVLLNDGEYITLAGLESIPGGIDMTSYTLDLWVSGDNSTNNSWKNINENAQFSLGPVAGAITPNVQNSKFNFHKELDFGASNDKLRTINNYNIAAGEGYYMFVVSDTKLQRNAYTTASLLNFQNSYPTSNFNLRWNNASAQVLVAYWPGSVRSPGFAQANHSQYGIATMNIANTNPGGNLFMYLNGVQNTGSLTFTGSSRSGDPLIIGSSSFTTTAGSDPFNGSIQEIILIRKYSATGSDIMSPGDLAKIHSYLAIKYGLMLYSGTGNTKDSTNYVNSNEYAVWNSVANAGYNNAVFGIGRDDASGLNQVQSRSVESDYITVFKGDAIQSLNDNHSRLLNDNTFLMLGSNGVYKASAIDYPYSEGTNFDDNTSITEKINYRDATTYRAQVSINNVSAGQSMTVNMKVVSKTARYVLVSRNNPNFPTGAGNGTYIYPITNQIANNVVINTGDYVTLAGYEPRPGGLDLNTLGYTLDLWVDGNHSTNDSWENLNENTKFSLEKFSTYAPIVRNSKFNYHRELNFSTNASKLRTSDPYNLSSGEGYYMFVVSDARAIRNTTNTLLTFNEAVGNSSLRWSTDNSNILSSSWTTSDRNTNFANPPHQRYGIAAMNIANVNNGNMYMYLNGVQSSPITLGNNAAAGPSNTSVRLLVGNPSNNATGTSNTSAFNGSIQEIILIRKKSVGSATDIMSAGNIARINSYLAIKYGLTLYSGTGNVRDSANYVNSEGGVVWDRIINGGYNENIFGIGRDDATGLYQKQSNSAENPHFAVYINEIKTLNSENTGELDNMQYLMLGSDENKVLMSYDGTALIAAMFENGPMLNVPSAINIGSPEYKAQITGPSDSMRVKLLAPSENFTHVLISTDPDFAPVDTRVYSISQRSVTVDLGVMVGSGTEKDYKYIKFIGCAPGPGGVNPGLALWLRADDITSIMTESSINNVGKLTGYPDAQYFENENDIPGVMEWNDLIREQSYAYNNGATTGTAGTNHRIPVFRNYAPEMNYHPSVQFWSYDGSHLSYLTNLKGILAAGRRPHSVIIMANNDFKSTDWINAMMFGITQIGSGFEAPAYGYQLNGTNSISGRFRFHNTGTTSTIDIASGSQNLFNPGTTTILDYLITDIGTGNNISAEFRFSGLQEVRSISPGSGNINYSLDKSSVLGGGYSYGRSVNGVISEIIIFDRLIEGNDLESIESYLALKYGVTLRPGIAGSNTIGRFTYKFSNSLSNRIIWDGNDPDPNSPFIKYYNRIGAVIRDDAARLDNFHAISTSTGSLLHIGVAGTALSADGSQVGELKNGEAIVFGDNNEAGTIGIQDPKPCGGIEEIFKRIWYLRKVTESETQPVLIGIQDNSGLSIGRGRDANGNIVDIPETQYYSLLRGMYDVSLIIADDPAHLDANTFSPKAVIPMTYINGEYQCSYTLSQEDTYITFGVKPNTFGCRPFENALFKGVKTFYWKDWTYSSGNRINSTTAAGSKSGVHSITIAPTPLYGDLGNDILVTSTKVSYPHNVRARRYYPRFDRDNLSVWRYTDVLGDNGAVTVEIDFNNPVLPEFSISGIGAHVTSYEDIEIIGTCVEGGISGIMPILSYAGNSKNARYTINGNRATVTRSGSTSATNVNGKVNVKFEGGVTKIIIKYKITNRVYGSRLTNIWISPINLRPVPPKPHINEDGLSFVKTTNKDKFLTCESVTYSFEIGNVTCENKEGVVFSDTLPPNMKWVYDSFGLDSKSDSLFQALNLDFTPVIGETPDGRSTLLIENMVIPCSSILRLSAKAAFIDEEMPKDEEEHEYPNNARIFYTRTVLSVDEEANLWSEDKYTLDPYTIITAKYSSPYKDIEVDDSDIPDNYRESDEITVSYTIYNPNDDPIMDMIFDIDFNEEFIYLPGTFSADWIEGGEGYELPVAFEDNSAAVAIEYGGEGSKGKLTVAGKVIPVGAGTSDEEVVMTGFAMPKGKLKITFTLKAPANAEDLIERDENNDPVLDEEGNPVMTDLEISYMASSGMSDVCFLEKISDLDGSVLIPYSKGIKAIISNKNATAKIKKK